MENRGKKPTKKSSIKVENIEDSEKRKNKEEKSPHVEYLENRQAGHYSDRKKSKDKNSEKKNSTKKEPRKKENR